MKNSMDEAITIKETGRSGVILALAAVYISWGSTYLAIKVALEAYPPFFLMGIRFFVFGLGMYAYLRLRGKAAPTLLQWRNAAAIGTLLLLGGSAGVAYAEQWVDSGLAALVIATTPLWTVLFAGFWKRWPNAIEWAGLFLGFAGVGVLNLDGGLRAHPAGAAVLVLAAVSWAFGSVWSQHMNLPKGLMAGAAEMVAGGAVVMLVGFLLMGERVQTAIAWRAVGAIVYLGVFGSLVGFTAYMYLLGKVRPAFATSYAYVNPVLAVLLGAWLLGERVTAVGVVAMLVILAGVALVVLGQRK
jgi:drug/metabolite transporter (DMT)-like permease